MGSAESLSDESDTPPAGTARYHALVDATASVVYRMNADWSELQLHGPGFLAEVPTPTRNWMDLFILDEDRPMVTAAILEAREARAPFELEHRVRRADGTVGWTHSRAMPVLNDRGEIVEWVGMATDITDRKSADRLRDYERRLYAAILNNTPDLAYVWDLNHRFIYANEGLLAMWGKTWEQAIGKHCLELGYEPWHAAMHDREIDQVVATRKPVRGQVPFNGTFGRRIYDYLLVPVIGSEGRVVAVAGTTRDVTEIYELQNSLRDADRRKDEFLATLAHELRNPLAPIRSATELLNREGLTADESRRLRAIIDRQVTHMVRLVDDLLDVSRITRGEIQLRREPTGLRQVVDATLEGVRDAIASRHHTLTVSLDEKLPLVNADATRLTQVLQNLLENAAKYTPERRPHRASGRESGRCVADRRARRRRRHRPGSPAARVRSVHAARARRGPQDVGARHRSRARPAPRPDARRAARRLQRRAGPGQRIHRHVAAVAGRRLEQHRDDHHQPDRAGDPHERSQHGDADEVDRQVEHARPEIQMRTDDREMPVAMDGDGAHQRGSEEREGLEEIAVRPLGPAGITVEGHRFAVPIADVPVAASGARGERAGEQAVEEAQQDRRAEQERQ